ERTHLRHAAVGGAHSRHAHSGHPHTRHSERHPGHPHSRHAHSGHPPPTRKAAHSRHSTPRHGFFPPPPPAHLLPSRALPHEPHVLTKAPHHLLHEKELLNELAHPLLGLPRSGRDSLHAAWLANEQIGIELLLAGHRLDHRLDAHELAVVEVCPLRDLTS